MVNKAKNIIFQLLPNHNEEDKIWIKNFIKDNNFKNYSINEIIEKIDGQIISTEFLEGICWCNKDKIVNAINLLKFQKLKNCFQKTNKLKLFANFAWQKDYLKKDFKIIFPGSFDRFHEGHKFVVGTILKKLIMFIL